MSKNPKLYYTAGELADLFELPKQTLLYYDKMGILSPEFISENNYRHYSQTVFDFRGHFEHAQAGNTYI